MGERKRDLKEIESEACRQSRKIKEKQMPRRQPITTERDTKPRNPRKKDEERIEEFRGKRQVLRRSMRNLKKSGEETWGGLKGKMEAGLDEIKEAFEGAVSGLEQKGAERVEKGFENLERYVRRREDQLKKWEARIDSLKNMADASKEEVRTKYLEQVEELRKTQEAAKKKLQDFKQSSGNHSWDDLKGGLDQALEDLKKSVKQAVSRFKEN